MEKQLNSSEQFFPGFSSLSILQEIQQDLERRNIQPEEFKDRIIFMSMFNDIEWRTNDENCVSNAEKVNNYAMRFSQGHWVQGRKRSGMAILLTLKKGEWYSAANKMVQRFKEIGLRVFRSVVALSRGILKQKIR